MQRKSTRLADGRELIYFDEHDGTVRNAPDRRELPQRAEGSELRYDAINDEWVAVASRRQDRTFLPPADQCPLCPSRDGRLSEIPDSDYDVAVFENRFPSFAVNTPEPERAGEGAGAGAGPGAEDLFAARAGIGRCEVVCFTSDHNASFAALTPERVRTVMAAWVDRTQALSELPGVEQVFCFENRGEEIGVTLHHPHGQIYAYPFVPPRTQKMLYNACEYAERTDRNLFDDVLAGERSAEVRVIADTEHWVAFVPYAAHWPVEVHLYPKQRVPDLVAMSQDVRDEFGPLYLRVLRAMDANFEMPVPYISAWYQAPVHEGRDVFAAHVEILSSRRAPNKLKYVAGSESAQGAWIADIPQEATAARLRELVGKEQV